MFIAPSGVPQGSHLGPLLFLFFINDLSWILNDQVGISIFADDLKNFKKVKSPSDIKLLQDSLDTLSDYCTRFKLNLNIDKCFHITFSRKVKRSFSSSYHLSGSQLTKVDSIKDLGVILDSKLTFNLHRKRCFNKALKMLGFIFRNCKDFRNVHSFKVLYYAHVRSHLEYCCQVWNPDKVTYSEELEKIHRKFVRYLFHKNLVPGYSPSSLNPYEYSYRTSLSHLHMQSLSSRRKFFDIDLIIKTFNGLINSSGFMRFFKLPPRIRDLRHTNSFLVSNNKCSSIDRCMKYFNDLQLDLNRLRDMPYGRAKRIVLNSMS